MFGDYALPTLSMFFSFPCTHTHRQIDIYNNKENRSNKLFALCPNFRPCCLPRGVGAEEGLTQHFITHIIVKKKKCIIFSPHKRELERREEREEEEENAEKKKEVKKMGWKTKATHNSSDVCMFKHTLSHTHTQAHLPDWIMGQRVLIHLELLVRRCLCFNAFMALEIIETGTLGYWVFRNTPKIVDKYLAEIITIWPWAEDPRDFF